MNETQNTATGSVVQSSNPGAVLQGNATTQSVAVSGEHQADAGINLSPTEVGVVAGVVIALVILISVWLPTRSN